MFSLLTFFALLFTILFITLVKGADFPKTTSASIYESSTRKGPSVTYKDDMGYWSNFPLLFKAYQMKKPTTICVRGAWLIYNQPDFRTPSVSDVHLFSGNENCVQPANMSSIGSMQPIGPFKFQQNSITLFDKKYFGSFGLAYYPQGTEVRKIRKQWLPTLESLITMGKTSWTLLDYEGQAYCIKPAASSLANPICFASDIEQSELPKGTQYYGVIAKCGDAEKYYATIELKRCKEFGGSKLEGIEPDSSTKKSLKSNNNKDDKLCNKEKPILNEAMIRKFAKLRFTHDFGSPDQLLWPTKPGDIWKTEILDMMYDIALATIPSAVVPGSYLHMHREFTVWHLNQAWTKSGAKAYDFIGKMDIEQVHVNMEICLDLAVEQRGMVLQAIMRVFEGMDSESELKTAILDDFVHDPKLDPIIDYSWIVTNYVFALCHHLHDYSTNFWAEYTNVIRDLYFVPLNQRWKEPKEISPASFAAIFGGYNMDSQFKRIGLSTSVVFDFTPNLLPIERALI